MSGANAGSAREMSTPAAQPLRGAGLSFAPRMTTAHKLAPRGVASVDVNSSGTPRKAGALAGADGGGLRSRYCACAAATNPKVIHNTPAKNRWSIVLTPVAVAYLLLKQQ